MNIYISKGHLDLEELQKANYLWVIHGGAGPADPKEEEIEKSHAAITRIAKEAGKNHSVFPHYFTSRYEDRLKRASDAEKVALHAAYLLEQDDIFNAGLGAALQEDGTARVSASYMESRHLKFSAVTNVTKLKHPSLLAFALQSKTFCCLDASGAERLSRELCFPVDNLVAPHRLEKWIAQRQAGFAGKVETGRSGTIGAVVIDADFHLAAITSTGGVSNETVGRVGDCPTVAGNYCTLLSAVSCTGWGEQIINDAVAARLGVRIEDGLNLEDAMYRTMKESARKSHRLAAIAVAKSADNRTFSWVTGSTISSFIWAANSGGKVQSFKDEVPILYEE